MTENQFNAKVQELENKARELQNRAVQDDWYAELDLRMTNRKLSELRYAYYNSLFK